MAEGRINRSDRRRDAAPRGLAVSAAASFPGCSCNRIVDQPLPSRVIFGSEMLWVGDGEPIREEAVALAMGDLDMLPLDASQLAPGSIVADVITHETKLLICVVR